MADSLKELFGECAGRGPELIQGSVISLSPLKIQAYNDSKFIIGKTSLVIPSRVYGSGFELGDSFHILVLNKGKKYYLLDRL